MLTTKGGMMHLEIYEQPASWQNAIKVYNRERETLVWIKKNQFTQVIFIGAGASYYAAVIGSYFFRNVGRISSHAFNSSDIYTEEIPPFDMRQRTLLVVLSRSGHTDETVWAVKFLKKIKPDIQVLSVICQKETPLEAECCRAITMEESIDDGILPIRSFSTTLFLIGLIAAAIGGNSTFLGEMSKILKKIDIKKYHDLIIKMRTLQDIKRAIFCGTGMNLALAGYGALVMQGMSLNAGQYNNSFEFRHNHYVSVNHETLATYILSDRLINMEVASMRDAAKMKGQILLLAETLEPAVEAGVEYAIKINSGLPPLLRIFHYIPCLQLVAFQTTMVKGKNPDKLKHVVDVVTYKAPPSFLA